MKIKALALNDKGQLTYCSVPPELRGIGRCNHLEHQELDETEQEFIARINQDKGSSEPVQGKMTIEPYRMTDEEMKSLPEIKGRKHLEDQDNEGGYIKLATPLWNDTDKSYYAELTNTPVSRINGVLNGESSVLTEVDESLSKRFEVGRIYTQKRADQMKAAHGDLIEFDSGVAALNKAAAERGFEATNKVYVLPYYMRQDPPGENEVKNPLNTLYNFLIVKRKDPDAQQKAYQNLIDNETAGKAIKNRGYALDSLSTLFKGKKGLLRGYMSGRKIMHSGRAVITPNGDLEYGELEVPPSILIDIYKPTLTDMFKQEGKTEEEISEIFRSYKGDQTLIAQEDREKLDEMIVWSGMKVVAIRQPSLHASSMLAFKPRVSPNATIRVNPLNFAGYNADIDGDTFTIFALNDVEISEKAHNAIGPHTLAGTRRPRAMEESINRPSKESLWGLLNVLAQRSDK